MGAGHEEGPSGLGQGDGQADRDLRVGLDPLAPCRDLEVGVRPDHGHLDARAARLRDGDPAVTDACGREQHELVRTDLLRNG